MPIQRQPIDSSMIAAAGYDAGSHIMEVEFKNGSVYRVEGVPPSTYEGLVGADSSGSYYNQNIKGRYPVIKIA